jgi:hypothetical protein
VTVFDVAHTQRAVWQRRAAAELARILEAHRDLPVRIGLALAEHHEHTGAAVTYLSAKDHRNGVRGVLLADLLDDAGGHR